MASKNKTQRKASVDRDDIERFLPNAEAKIQELVQAVSALPAMGPDGSSECPFAGQLYAKKDALQQEVQALAPLLNRRLQQVNAAIHACTANTDTVRGHEGKVHSSDVRGHYSEAGRILEEEYRGYLELRDRIQLLIKAASHALAEAGAARVPAQRPPDSSGRPVREPGSPGETQTSPPVAPNPELDLLWDIDQGRRASPAGSPGPIMPQGGRQR